MRKQQSAPNWRLFAATVPLVLIGAALLFWFMPDRRGLVWLGIYTIPSHMFISPFPHEPALLYYSKFYPALGCAIASIIGAIIAGFWDYALFTPLIHHPRVRSKYEQVGLYRVSVNFFRKSPFWALVVVGLTPLPFYPMKFLSISDGYPMKRYLAALVVGRTPRYYLIAYLGYVLNLPNWSLVTLGLVVLVVTLFKYYQQRKEQ